jgi:hypothetical protein
MSMPAPTVEIDASSIVITGTLNPKIFQPQWFALQQLISKADADNSNIKIIHPQISQFETDDLTVLVTTDRFVASTKGTGTGVKLRDLVLGTFFILEHTPITAIGLNRQMHFAMGSETAWHALGDKLAPKEPWNEVMPGRPGPMPLSSKSSTTALAQSAAEMSQSSRRSERKANALNARERFFFCF